MYCISQAAQFPSMHNDTLGICARFNHSLPNDLHGYASTTIKVFMPAITHALACENPDRALTGGRVLKAHFAACGPPHQSAEESTA